jgi:hypothetical protein
MGADPASDYRNTLITPLSRHTNELDIAALHVFTFTSIDSTLARETQVAGLTPKLNRPERIKGQSATARRGNTSRVRALVFLGDCGVALLWARSW